MSHENKLLLKMSNHLKVKFKGKLTTISEDEDDKEEKRQKIMKNRQNES